MRKTEQKPPDHFNNFVENLSEIENLLDIHMEISGGKRWKRKANVQTLNKSAIVLLTACWESFIEELASTSFDFLLNNARTYKSIPIDVLVLASRDLKEDKDERQIWNLADEGWKLVLQKYKKEILDNKIDYFHSPKADRVEVLFKKLIGVDITSYWKWRWETNKNAKNTLEKYIDLRWDISHKLRTKKTVLKKEVQEYKVFLQRLALVSHNWLDKYLTKITWKEPWGEYLLELVTEK